MFDVFLFSKILVCRQRRNPSHIGLVQLLPPLLMVSGCTLSEVPVVDKLVATTSCDLNLSVPAQALFLPAMLGLLTLTLTLTLNLSFALQHLHFQCSRHRPSVPSR